MLTTQLATTRLAELLRRTIEDLQAIERLLPDTMRRLDDAEPGYPGGGHGGSGSDDGPLRSTVILGDAAIRDRRAVDELSRAITVNSRTLLGICQRWGITRHGNNEGVDERSTVCDWCGHDRDVKTRRLCNWCTNTFGAVNAERRKIGRQPLNRLPAPALEHRRNARTPRVTDGDIARWARNGGK